MVFASRFSSKSAGHNLRKSVRPSLEQLESLLLLSFADGNGAVITNLNEQNNGVALVITFDGPLNANPANALQSPTNTANYSIEVPSSNPEVITSSLSTIPISAATYNSATNQVTLTLGSALAQGLSYRVFVNGIAYTESTTAPGLVDTMGQAIDGDYDDTASGDFYGLFAWTTAGNPIDYIDSSGAQVGLTLTGPGQLNSWRELDGDFDAGDLTAQANLASGLVVQQLSVANGVGGATTLSGSATFPSGSSNVVIIPPTIAGTFTNTLPSYFQTSVSTVIPPSPVVATANNLPYTIQITPVNFPSLPALQSAVAAQDNVAGSPYLGDWLLFGGRTNGLHTFNSSGDFPPQDQNESIYVFNPTTGQSWTTPWSATDVASGLLPPLYSSNQESFQNGDTLYTVGGYGAVNEGNNTYANYTTYDSLTALSVNGMINAVVTKGDVAALSQIQQIQDPRLRVTGGEMKMLNGLAYLVVGQDFEGQYNPGSTTGFTQTYVDEIQAFQINYNGATPNSLSISDYQAQNDQVNLRRRDYNLGTIVLPSGRQALEIYGGVFTPGPGSLTTAGTGYRAPIIIQGIGETEIGTFQQAFSQYSAAQISLYDAGSGTMNTISFGGISLYDINFATGFLASPFDNFPPVAAGLPFVNDVSTIVQNSNGSTQELEMPTQLPGLYGSESRFFAIPGLSDAADGVLNLAPLLTQPTTIGYVYGGIVSTASQTSNQTTQTMATSQVFKIILIPNTQAASNTTLVQSLYHVLLGRAPDAAGEAAWVNRLNSGVPASSVAMSFITSTEHRTLELDDYYSRFLGRTPDAPGLQAYLNEYAHGATDQQMIAQFLNSPEYQKQSDLSGDTGSSVVVTALYIDLLNRAPTSNEVTFWVDQLKAGTTMATVVNDFLTCTEYRTDMVNDYYTTYLGRAADPSGEAAYLHLLQKGASTETVVASMMGLTEYFNNHPGAG